MLTKFAAALLATSLIAGSPLAAHPSGTLASNSTQAAQSQPSSTAHATKPGKTVKHAAKHRNHVRKHEARAKGHVVHHARHTKPAKTVQAGMNKSAKRS
jgi:hypothetical protein